MRWREKGEVDARGAKRKYIPPERMLTAAGVGDYSAEGASRLRDASICSNNTAWSK